MIHSKKSIPFLAMAIMLGAVALLMRFKELTPTPVPLLEDSSFLLESSVSSSTSSSGVSVPPVSSKTLDSSSSEQSLEHSSSGDWDHSWFHFKSARMGRSADWKQIVTNSPFQLGKPVEKLDEDGELCYYTFKWGAYPHLDGSSVAMSMAIEFFRQHLNLSDEQAWQLTHFNQAHNAYTALVRKEKALDGSYDEGDMSFYPKESPPDLLIATEPSDDELALAKRHKVTLVTRPVCYDAFVFITHKENPIDSLTMEQIQKIYSGDITNWKEVGGFDVPIIAYQREKNSDRQTAMENLVMRGKPMIDAPLVWVCNSGNGPLEVVADYQNRLSSIGYTYKYDVDNLHSDPNIKTIAIDGIPPTEDNIRNMTYPLSTNYYGVIRGGEENGVGGKFLDWMLSAEGQACIAQAGYIPIKRTN